MSPQRRTFSKDFKVQVIEECAQPGTSVASVALRHGLNTNLVHKWLHRERESRSARPAFIPVPLDLIPPRQADTGKPIVRIDIPYCSGSLSVHWPVQDAEGCARFVRELLA